MENRTTLQVRKNILKDIIALKKYKRETNHDVLDRLVKKEMNRKKIKRALA